VTCKPHLGEHSCALSMTSISSLCDGLIVSVILTTGESSLDDSKLA
jgi:hypothetical protein